jgi:amidase
MTKTALDLAHLLDIMVEPSRITKPKAGYASVATGKWTSIRIGVLKPEDWLHDRKAVKPVHGATEQIVSSESFSMCDTS